MPKGVYKRGNVWWIQWQDLEGKRHREPVGPLLSHAIRAREQRLADRRNRQFNLGYRTPTLGEFVEQHYRPEVLPTKKPSTRVGYEGLLAKHLLPAFGALPLGAITRGRVGQFIAERAHLAPSTVRNAVALLSGILTYAVEYHNLLSATPISGVLKPQNFPWSRPATRQHFLEPLPFVKAVEALRPEDREPVLVAALTGLSWQELIALQPGDINLATNKILVQRGIWGGVEQTPKSKHRVRTVEMCPTVRRILSGRLDHAECFPGLSRQIARRWRAVSGLRWHDLRHQYAVLCIMAGKHPRWIQAQMGHSDIRLTMNTYGGLMETIPVAHVEWIDDLLPLEGALPVPGIPFPGREGQGREKEPQVQP